MTAWAFFRPVVLFKNSIAKGEGKVVAWLTIMVMIYFGRTVVQKDPKACFRLGVCTCAFTLCENCFSWHWNVVTTGPEQPQWQMYHCWFPWPTVPSHFHLLVALQRAFLTESVYLRLLALYIQFMSWHLSVGLVPGLGCCKQGLHLCVVFISGLVSPDFISELLKDKRTLI